jgi:hypothetical protein
VAKYTDLTYQRGTKDSADIISQEKPLEISNKIWMTDPNSNKALGWMMSNSGKVSSGNRIFGHLEDAPFPNWVEYAAADEASQAVTGLVFTAGAGLRCALGSRIYFPRIEEIIRCTADFASTTTSAAVARNFGRGVAATSLLKNGDKGFILPPAMFEGFTTGNGMTSTLYYKSFNMTEISYPVQVTYVDNHETYRGGLTPFQRNLKKAIKQGKDQSEGEMFFGGQVTDNTTYAHPIGASDGIDNYVTTHSYVTDRLSRMDFFDILTEWRTWYKGPGAIFCSTAFASMVTSWAMNSTTMTIPVTGQTGEGQIGMEINRVKWLNAEYDLIDVDLLGQETYLMGKVFFVPKGHAQYVFLQGLDVYYNPISRDEIHSDEGEIYGVRGWEFSEEELWSKISGLRF